MMMRDPIACAQLPQPIYRQAHVAAAAALEMTTSVASAETQTADRLLENVRRMQTPLESRLGVDPRIAESLPSLS